MSAAQATARMEVGILLCGQVRRYLERERFLGRNIRWHEGGGIVSREFIIKGDEPDVRAIYRTLAPDEDSE